MNRLLLPRHAVRVPPLRITRPYSHTFTPGPAPPKLPASQQAEFERLQRKASASTQPDTDTSSAPPDDGARPGLFRGAPPEFQGDTNPKTGEVGGPKNEPLRWGGEGDWSYNGRVTDF